MSGQRMLSGGGSTFEVGVYIYPRAQAAGAVTQEPFFRPYGWHMFRMADPAGNHINIYTVPTAAE